MDWGNFYYRVRSRARNWKSETEREIGRVSNAKKLNEEKYPEIDEKFFNLLIASM